MFQLPVTRLYDLRVTNECLGVNFAKRNVPNCKAKVLSSVFRKCVLFFWKPTTSQINLKVDIESEVEVVKSNPNPKSKSWSRIRIRSHFWSRIRIRSRIRSRFWSWSRIRSRSRSRIQSRIRSRSRSRSHWSHVTFAESAKNIQYRQRLPHLLPIRSSWISIVKAKTIPEDPWKWLSRRTLFYFIFHNYVLLYRRFLKLLSLRGKIEGEKSENRLHFKTINSTLLKVL